MENADTPQTDAKAKPVKALPTRRISFDTQLDLLRAYGAAGAEGKGVTNEDLAGIVNIRSSSASLVNTFFSDVGLVMKAERGNAPVPEVVEFQRAYQWDPEHAAAQLAPILKRTWFYQTLAPKLAFNALKEAAAIAALGQAAAAEKHYYPELRLLLDFLTAAELITQDAGMVSLVHPAEGGARRDDEQGAEKPRPASAAPTAPARGALPLLIQGLLEQLPRDHQWTRAKAEKWLDLARLTFEIVYEFEPDQGHRVADQEVDQEAA
jgi:hypothetical protein